MSDYHLPFVQWHRILAKDIRTVQQVVLLWINSTLRISELLDGRLMDIVVYICLLLILIDDLIPKPCGCGTSLKHQFGLMVGRPTLKLDGDSRQSRITYIFMTVILTPMRLGYSSPPDVTAQTLASRPRNQEASLSMPNRSTRMPCLHIISCCGSRMSRPYLSICLWSCPGRKSINFSSCFG
jgi:hypothetical protein